MNKAQQSLITALVSLVIATFAHSAIAKEGPKDIRLVLQLTVDGLRADLLTRYADRFSDNGFRLLERHGTVFANAHYQHANTETIVGHSTLATGAQPSMHGMTGNVWFDAEADELTYNIEDAQYPLIPTRKQKVTGEQVDPAQKLARTSGRSPRSLLAETFSDKLKAHTGGRAKIFAVSGKDRGAVALAGKAGKAFWMSTDSGDFVTSTYYYETYPGWVVRWNSKRKAQALAGKQWSLLNDADSYLLAHQDDRPYETDLRGYGRVFPHRFGGVDDKLLYTKIVASPYGDQLTADFAKQLVVSEQLGIDSLPDFLSVSFSGVDAINHFFGPSSLENEDIVLQLDRTLADLLAFVDKKVGLKHTLIVLSADHGMPEMPEFMAKKGMAVGRIHTEDVIKAVNEIGMAKFGIKDVAKRFFRPYLYLDDEVIKAAKLERSIVEQAVADALTGKEGIALAVASTALRHMQDTTLLNRIRNNTHPGRSGDIYVVQEPYWFLFEKGPIGVMHGSPWGYDTFVPIIFSGPGIAANTIYRRVHPVDVAPTLSAFFGMKPASSSSGEPLKEVLR